ncbi:MAG: Hsp20/alpha crystallin family protein [Candidatus Omnitrophota bacterium]
MPRSNKILTGLVIFLAICLIFEVGYLLGKRKRTIRAEKRLERDPFIEMQQMHRKMDRMFRDSFSRMMYHPDFKMLKSGLTFEPDIDITEKDKEYIVMVDLPGVNKDKINVEIEGNMLTISGERHIEKNASKEELYKAERSFGSFSRTITLPGKIKADEVTATSESGVLLIRLPKEKRKEEGEQPKVEIKVD